MPAPETMPATPIDMTRTMAPEIPGFREYIQNGLASVADLPDLTTTVQRHRFHGTGHDREVAAQWLGQRLGETPDTRRLLVTGGTQNILMILFSRLVPKGSVIAAEKLTYAAIGQLAMLAGITVLPVDIDEEGMREDSLEALCKNNRITAIYTNPTGHNPTTSIMSLHRRQKIAAVAREYNVDIIEDDVHGLITRDAPPPIAAIAPELTWYMMTVSKCMGIGLRTAFLIAPSPKRLSELLEPIPSISAWFVPGVSAALITHLIENGAADKIAAGITNEIEARQDMAREVLGPLGVMHTNRSSLHIWIDLPRGWTIEAFIDAAADKGVTLRHPGIFAVPGVDIKGQLRMSMIAPPTHKDLREGLLRMASLLKSGM